MKTTLLSTLNLLAFAAFSLAAPVAEAAPVPASPEVLKMLKERNSDCVPFCEYPGDVCCNCCD